MNLTIYVPSINRMPKSLFYITYSSTSLFATVYLFKARHYSHIRKLLYDPTKD